MFVPVEFQRGGQVVNLGQAQILRADAGLGVGDIEDVVFEHPFGGRDGSGGISGDIGQFGQVLRVVRGSAGDRAHRGNPAVDPACFSVKALLAMTRAAAPSLVAQMSSSRSGSDTTGLASTSSIEVSLR